MALRNPSHCWRRQTGLTAIFSILLLLLGGCSSANPASSKAAVSPLSPLPAPARATGPLVLTLIHSNDTWGYVDPCG